MASYSIESAASANFNLHSFHPMFPDVCVRFFCCFLAYFIQEHDMENCDERAERIESYLEKSIGYENVV